MRPIVQNDGMNFILGENYDFMLHLPQGKYKPMDSIGAAAYYLLVSAFIMLYEEFGLYLHPQGVLAASLSVGVLMVSGTGLSTFWSSPVIPSLL